MAGKKKSDTAAIAAVAKQTEKLKKAADEAKAAEAKVEKETKKNVTKSKKESDKESVHSRSPSPVRKPTSKSKSTDEPKEKRPPNAYQIFRKQKLEELREEYDDEETRPAYQDLMKMVNEAWAEEKEKMPKKEKIPKEKKERKPKNDDDNKKKRAPSAYNIFIKEIMPKIKSEHENDDPKLNQKDLMKIAAEKWNKHKESIAA
jgi:hypothetical protein